MRELGIAVTPQAVCAHYGDVLDGMLVDERDGVAGLDLPHAACDTLMKSLDDRVRVARAALALAAGLR